jgi:NhaA family Na+:H+ antiporter
MLWLSLGGVAVLFTLNRLGVRRLGAYFLIGVIMWVCVLKSGVHATLAGVALGFAIPLRVRDADDHSLLRHLEHRLHPWVAYMILPLFAFANSGVALAGLSTDVLFGSVALGIACGLFFGKTIGVFCGALLAIKGGIARLPLGVSWPAMLGVSMLAGVGFTMSLFIGSLGFEHAGAQYAVATRLGVIGGSIVSALAGLLWLRAFLPSVAQSTGEPDS